MSSTVNRGIVFRPSGLSTEYFPVPYYNGCAYAVIGEHFYSVADYCGFAYRQYAFRHFYGVVHSPAHTGCHYYSSHFKFLHSAHLSVLRPVAPDPHAGDNRCDRHAGAFSQARRRLA